MRLLLFQNVSTLANQLQPYKENKESRILTHECPTLFLNYRRGWWIVTPFERLCFQDIRPSSLLKIDVKTSENGLNGVFFIPSISVSSRINFNHQIREETISHHSPRSTIYILKAWHALRAEDTYVTDFPINVIRHRYPFFNAPWIRHWKAGSSGGSVSSAFTAAGGKDETCISTRKHLERDWRNLGTSRAWPRRSWRRSWISAGNISAGSNAASMAVPLIFSSNSPAR